MEEAVDGLMMIIEAWVIMLSTDAVNSVVLQ
jgi:hypothetical protein